MELVIIVILSLLVVPLVFLTTGSLRIILGLAFVLFFPGYSLMAALFPRKSTLNGIERLAISFGLSIAVVSLIGLILNYTPWGIRLYTILVSLLVFILSMLVVTWYRRQKLPQEERFQLKFRLRFFPWPHLVTAQGRWGKVATTMLVLAILGAAGMSAYVIAMPNVGEKFTEFYIAQPGPLKEDPPRVVTSGEELKVPLGIVNYEGWTMEYTVQVVSDGQNIAEIGPIVLEYEEKWEHEMTFVLTEPGESQKVEFWLYTETDAEPYRKLHLWIGVTEE